MRDAHSNIQKLFRYADRKYENTDANSIEKNGKALNHVCIFSSQYFDGFTVRKRHLSVPYLCFSLVKFTGRFSSKAYSSRFSSIYF